MSEFMLLCPKCDRSVAVKKTENGTSYVCPECGKSVDASRFKILSLGDLPVAFSESVQKYADFYREASKFATENAAHAEEKLKNIKSIEDFSVFYQEGCLRFFKDSVNIAVKVLTSQGIYEYDYSAFVDYLDSRSYGKEIYAYNFLKDLNEYVEKKADEKEAHEEYLRLQDQSRGRWSGGGFGLKGALKGAAMAGALNLAEDFGSALSQSWQRSNFDDKLKKEMIKVCHDEDVIGKYKEAVRRDTIDIMSALYEICANHGLYSSKQYHLYGIDNSDKAILNNILKKLLPFEDAVSAILRIILKNPFRESSKLLGLLFAYKGGMNGDILRFAEYVSADRYIFDIVLSDAEKLFKEPLEKCRTSEDYNNVEEKIRLHAAEVGINPEELTCFAEAVKKGQEAKNREIADERQSRTFKNVVYDTVEEKQAVEQHSNEINSAYKQLVEKINSAKLLNSSPSDSSILNLDGWLDSIIDNDLKGWAVWQYDNEIKRFTDIADDKYFEGGEEGKKIIREYVAQLEKFKQKAIKTEEKNAWNSACKGEKSDKSNNTATVIDAFLNTDFSDKESVNALRVSLKENRPMNLESFNSAIEFLSTISPTELKLLQNHTLFLTKGFGNKVLLKIPITFGIIIAILTVMTLLRDIPKIMTMEQYKQVANIILYVWLIGISLYLIINIFVRCFAHDKWKVATVNRSLLHPMLQSPKQYVEPNLVIGTSKERKEARSREAMQKQLEIQQKKANGKRK